MPSTPSRTQLLAGCLVVSVLAAGIPLTVAAAGGTTESGSFGDNTVSVTRGETVEVTVAHSDTAHVFVGSERSGFLLEVVLGGSGTDTFTIDTYESTGAPSSYVSGASSVTLHTKPLSRPLAATTYAMNVTVGGVEQDVGSLTVDPRGEMNATTRVAPASLLDADAVDAAGAMAASTPNETVTHGDVAVIPVRESGLETALNPDDVDGDGNANGVDVRLHELDPEPNTPAETLVVAEEPGLTVLPDLENDRFLVLWDTRTRTLRPQSDHTWRLDVTLTPANALVETETLVASTRLRLVEPVVHTTGPAHQTIYPWEAPQVTVNGTTNRPPGTVLNARAKSLDPPFLAQQNVEVTANQTFHATLDVSRSAPGQTVPVWVLHNRRETKRTVVRYAETASFGFHDQVSNGRLVAVDAVHLGSGGFVEIRQNGTRVGVSPHLAPGTHEDLTIALDDDLTGPSTVTVVARLDRDLDGAFDASTDRAYVQTAEDGNETTVTASAMVRLQGTGATTTTSTTTARSTTTPGTTTSTTTRLADAGPLVERTPIPAIAAAESGASVPFPGWGVVVALVAGGVLAHRRRGDRA